MPNVCPVRQSAAAFNRLYKAQDDDGRPAIRPATRASAPFVALGKRTLGIQKCADHIPARPA
jgi:hypothetical protein